MHRRAGTWSWRSSFLGALVGAVVILLGSPAMASTTLHVWEMDEPDGTGTMVDTGAPTQTNGTWLNIEAGVDGFGGTAYRSTEAHVLPSGKTIGSTPSRGSSP
jgi:hypothetical protein